MKKWGLKSLDNDQIKINYHIDAKQLADKKWLSELGYGKIFEESPIELRIDRDLGKARDFLLHLIDNPNKITEMKTTFKQIKDILP